MQPFILGRIELRLQFLRVNSVMAPYPGKISSFYKYFYSNSIDFFFIPTHRLILQADRMPLLKAISLMFSF